MQNKSEAKKGEKEAGWNKVLGSGVIVLKGRWLDENDGK